MVYYNVTFTLITHVFQGLDFTAYFEQKFIKLDLWL